MNRTLKLWVAAFLLAPWSVSQAITLTDDLSLDLNVGAYSDYRSRGISQTQGDPAIQGSATLVHSSGLYAGIWSSNVDFGYGSRTRQEIDYYVGYFWQATDDVSLDLTYYEYEYPKQADINQSETYAKLTVHGAYVGGYYSNEVAGNQSYLYSFVGYTTNLPGDIGLDMRYGLIDYKDPLIVDNQGRDRDSYNEWEVKLSKNFVSADWSLAYVDTDLSDTECSNFTGFNDTCSSTLVLGVSKSF